MIHLLDAQLHTAVLDTFEAEFGKRPADAQIQIQSTRAEFDGDRTLVVFPLADGRSPSARRGRASGRSLDRAS